MPMSAYIGKLREKIGSDLLLVIGVAGIVVNEGGQVLLQRRSDNGVWGLPGGALDPGEQPADCVIREVREETGLEVVPERIVTIDGGPESIGAYPNGDRIAVLGIVFACRPVRGEARVNDDESLEVRYFAPEALPPLSRRVRFRIEQALRNEPRTYFRHPEPDGGQSI